MKDILYAQLNSTKKKNIPDDPFIWCQTIQQYSDEFSIVTINRNENDEKNNIEEIENKDYNDINKNENDIIAIHLKGENKRKQRLKIVNEEEIKEEHWELLKQHLTNENSMAKFGGLLQLSISLSS